MTVYDMNIEILTPVHIGSGDELLPFEYRMLPFKKSPTDSNPEYHFIKMNMQHVMNLMGPVESKEFQQSLGNMVDIRLFFEKLFKTAMAKPADAIEYKVNASKEAFEWYKLKMGDVRNALELRTFIKHPGVGAYIPGSSIKGALKGAWLQRRMVDQKSDVAYTYERQGRVPRIIVDNQKSHLRTQMRDTSSLLGIGDRPSQNDICLLDPFKAVKISDTNAGLPTFVCRTGGIQWAKIDKEAPERTLQKFGAVEQNFEVIPHKAMGNSKTISGRIIIDEIRQGLQKLLPVDAETLIRCANELSGGIIEGEIDFFSRKAEPNIEARRKNALEATNNVQAAWKEVKDSSNACVLRLGWGAGFNSMSFNLTGENPLDVKTRKLADDNWPLGWVKIQLTKV